MVNRQKCGMPFEESDDEKLALVDLLRRRLRGDRCSVLPGIRTLKMLDKFEPQVREAGPQRGEVLRLCLEPPVASGQTRPKLRAAGPEMHCRA
jgi:hypothetical protein